MDAGAVTAFGLDPDGSAPDVGAYGGLEAEQPPDEDGDGWDYRLDCDDTEASAYPGAEELLGDGVDNDCDGLVDEGTHTGLDDTAVVDDTGVHSGLDDTSAHSGLDDSGQGLGFSRSLSGGCSAAGAPDAGWGALLLLLGLGGRRRRRPGCYTRP
ncbi:MAG: putative metal-binding motif-containing protein [Alphaproteobacteria bacterium]|nr:putative metal-binding motif-containing protein [Alphaproteobacteria bacterium]MCB9793375.1 putative metal-binding motif-containing protein [Alphaproteobacteria bacterium]